MPSVTYYPPEDAVKVKGVIVAFHGGCFTGGSTSWDKDQNEHMAALGYKVIQVDFPKDHLEFQVWAQRHRFTEPEIPLGV